MSQLPTQHPYKDIIEKVRWAKKGVTDESSWKFQIEMQKEIFVQVQKLSDIQMKQLKFVEVKRIL